MSKPLAITHAEQLLSAMQRSGLTPAQVAEALHTAIFLLAKGNSLSLTQMEMVFRQEMEHLEGTTVFVADLPKGPKL